MAPEKFCRAVHHQINTEADRLLVDRSTDGVVAWRANAVEASELCDVCQVSEGEQRVGGRLDDH